MNLTHINAFTAAMQRKDGARSADRTVTATSQTPIATISAAKATPTKTVSDISVFMARGYPCDWTKSRIRVAGSGGGSTVMSKNSGRGPYADTLGRAGAPDFRQCGFAGPGCFGHRFKKFGLPHRLALSGCVNLPSPRLGRTPLILDGEGVINRIGQGRFHLSATGNPAG